MSTLSDSSQDSLGWVYPLPPQTVVTQVEEIVGVVSGVTSLVEDQEYVDVVFGTEQPDDGWVLMETTIFNIVDVAPLNLWCGVVTAKTAAGFRVQLNGLPDSANYYLSWSIRGVFGYYLSGPSSGNIGASSTFTVRLPDESTLSGTATITPSDGGIGGFFTPSSVELSTEEPSATFTYTGLAYGARSISATNDRGLTNPVEITYTIATPTYALTGPSEGDIDVESTDFTLTLSGSVLGTLTVTPDDGSDGVFTPTTVALTTGAPSDTFTYTPASEGTKTISVTNSGGLANPVSLSYEVIVPFDPTVIAGMKLWLIASVLTIDHVDGDPVLTWPDQSVSGYTMLAVGGGGKPTYKASILNGEPVIRFNGTDNAFYQVSDLGVASPYTIFVCGNWATDAIMFLTGGGGTAHFRINGGKIYMYNPFTDFVGTATVTGAPHVLTAVFNGAGSQCYVDGVLDGAGTLGTNMIGTLNISFDGTTNFYPGDVAEILVYNSALSTGDRNDVVDYMKTKYGIT